MPADMESSSKSPASAATAEDRGQPVEDRAGGSGAIIFAIVILLIYQGYTLSIVGIASPWIAKSFHLDQASIARLFAWISLSAVGSIMLSRAADRVGRRRIMLLGLAATPLC